MKHDNIKSHRKLFIQLINELQEYDLGDVAYTAEVSESTLYNWINLKVRTPHLRTMYNVAHALGFDLTLVKRRAELKAVA